MESFAAALEKSVSSVLDEGYRTGDLIAGNAAGVQVVGCKKMKELLLDAL